MTGDSSLIPGLLVEYAAGSKCRLRTYCRNERPIYLVLENDNAKRRI